MSFEEEVWIPDEEFIIETHEIMIEQFGGWPGFEVGIQAYKTILEEIKTAKGIYRKAVILLRRIITTRMFKDGNHRTAQVVSQTFLEMNRKKLNVQNKSEIVKFIKDIMFYNIDEIERWLRNGVK